MIEMTECRSTALKVPAISCICLFVCLFVFPVLVRMRASCQFSVIVMENEIEQEQQQAQSKPKRIEEEEEEECYQWGVPAAPTLPLVFLSDADPMSRARADIYS